MSALTPIEWCDSTVNPVMGCDGCELWQPERDIRICYAGTLHEMRGGNPGYSTDFLVPETFVGRMSVAASWRDLRGIPRPNKPWLDGRRRHVFVSDMGDALSASVTFEYLHAEIIVNVQSNAGHRHVWLWLTKQPKRMAQFAAWLGDRGISWPGNLWAGTSLTEPQYKTRLDQLRRVPAPVRFLSIEPQAADVGELDLRGIHWAIMGGQSGKGARPYHLEWPYSLIRQCRAAGCAPFVKQLGTHPFINGVPYLGVLAKREGERGYPVGPKGGNWESWPEDLRVREFPR